VDECTPLVVGLLCVEWDAKGEAVKVKAVPALLDLMGRGLHSLPSKLNLRTFGNTSLLLELKLSTFGLRPRVHLGYMGDKVSLR